MTTKHPDIIATTGSGGNTDMRKHAPEQSPQRAERETVAAWSVRRLWLCGTPSCLPRATSATLIRQPRGPRNGGLMWFWQRSKSALRIAPPVRRVTGRGGRVSALIDGRGIWFESADTKLAASAEAFGSLMLIPALHARRPLVIVPPVCGVWAANTRQIVPLVSSWWGYDPVLPRVTEIAPGVSPGGSTALCFSGGVDSFFTLLRGTRPVDVLVCAIGYDLKLRDTRRRARVEHSVRAVAAEMDLWAWLLASNLRQHRTMRAVPWERSHGGVLAALGHVLGGK
jgi:hypothetical protein